tara:strand:- start:160 stop:561 length:402 start_codon:yes stop_codon:yes gene_type:complete
LKQNPKFKTINEVAKQFNIPQHVLRFWENKFKQLSPLKLSGNRRYYRKSDIELINYIKNLLYIDCISIKGVQKIFGNQKINKIINSSNPIFKKVTMGGSKNILKENNFNNQDTKKLIKEFCLELKKIESFLDK